MSLNTRLLFLPILCVAFSFLVLAMGDLAYGQTMPGPSDPPTAKTEPPAAKPDKRGFTLFNPTPTDAMRDMVSDRPDVTEGPVTVDAGHLQIESSFIEYDHDRAGSQRSDTLAVLPTNLKIGLLNNADLEFVFTPYVTDSERSAGRSARGSGFGDDTELRLKVNFWGNDGPSPLFGDTAFGILPFVKFPTGTGGLSNNHVEGGLILPFAIKLPANFGLGAMAEFDATYNDATGGYGVDFVHSVTLDHDIPGIKNLGGYIEYVGVAPHQTGGSYRAIASFGLSYALTANWSVDGGSTIGLSHSAETYTLFLGTSVRF